MGPVVTVAPRRPPLAFDSIDEVAAALRDAGSRLTTPRRLILEVLFAAHDLVSADQIAATARVDLTSVYRNLERLEELGVVRHVHVGHGPSVYGLVGHGEREFLVLRGLREGRRGRARQRWTASARSSATTSGWRRGSRTSRSTVAALSAAEGAPAAPRRSPRAVPHCRRSAALRRVTADQTDLARLSRRPLRGGLRPVLTDSAIDRQDPLR